jgi:hypothetical protein
MTLAEQAFAWALVVPKIVEEDEAFFMIRSRSLRLRQVHAPYKPWNPEFHLCDLERAGSSAAQFTSQP